MKTLEEIESAMKALPPHERMRLYKDIPPWIGPDAEGIDWQRLSIESFFQDDSPDDDVYD